MRRGSVSALVGIGVVAGGIAAAVALLLPWLPTPASREAGRIDFVFWFVIGICIFIFSIVVAALLYSIVRFRAAPGDDSDGKPIHGHTGLEIAWTLVPTLLVTAIGIVSAVVLAQNDALGKDVLHVDVTAQQFAWTFSYPDEGGVTSSVLRLPKGRSVLLSLHSKDVIHAFWVPDFSQKQDIVPGLTTTLHITPTRLGTFPVVCTELCGLGHALMRSEAIVMDPGAFDAWVKGQAQATTSANPATAGKAVFQDNGCGSCHTLTAAGASGTVGPNLDKLATYAAQFHQAPASFALTQITHPDTFRQPGYPQNVMPRTFGS
ncbi:MAG: cytochrome c oxidase subunit II, partial [Acidobacteriota bacterium]|nr:cytochrome c oxidase subunit II [Acidobacteriota bacterium]